VTAPAIPEAETRKEGSMTRSVALVLVAGVLAGCASAAPPPPSVFVTPLKNQSGEQQVKDMQDCQVLAQRQTGYDPATSTAKGAGIGAAVGALGGAAAGAAIGAATGSAGKGAAIGAASGAVLGAAGGGAYNYSASKEGYNQAYANCMIGRGYAVR
jgi:hypothetical protein